MRRKGFFSAQFYGMMGKKHKINKLQLVKDIQSAAVLYKKHLVGRKFLYIFEGKWIEVVFTVKGFKHLTGVESPLSPKMFYDNAVRQRLMTSNIYFTSDHPYKLCVRKVAHLSQLPNIATSEGFLLQNIATNTQNYKFGATDLDFTLLFNQTIDRATGNAIGDSLHVESLRDEDCFNRSSNVYEVSHILSKENNSRLYNTVHYIDSRTDIRNIPEELISKIDGAIL